LVEAGVEVSIDEPTVDEIDNREEFIFENRRWEEIRRDFLNRIF
jgi:hypothetical protein